MRSGFENAVAVYWLSAESPGRPQSHTGPTTRRRPLAHDPIRSDMPAARATPRIAIPAGDTVPLRVAPAEIAIPFIATKDEPTRTPSAISVIESNRITSHGAASPNTTHPTARIAMPARIESGASFALTAASLLGSARNGIANAF